jgi:hypothetical protein
MYVQYRREEEKWVGDEIDVMKDNILFFSLLSGERKIR